MMLCWIGRRLRNVGERCPLCEMQEGRYSLKFGTQSYKENEEEHEEAMFSTTTSRQGGVFGDPVWSQWAYDSWLIHESNRTRRIRACPYSICLALMSDSLSCLIHRVGNHVINISDDERAWGIRRCGVLAVAQRLRNATRRTRRTAIWLHEPVLSVSVSTVEHLSKLSIVGARLISCINHWRAFLLSFNFSSSTMNNDQRYS